MAGVQVLLEVPAERENSLEMFGAATTSSAEAERQASDFLSGIGGLGIEFDDGFAPVPMYAAEDTPPGPGEFLEAFSPRTAVAPPTSRTFILPAEVTRTRLDELQGTADVTVWPNSQITLLGPMRSTIEVADSRGGVDCRPFRPAVELDVLRDLLGVDALWNSGFRGQNIIVGILDEGVDGNAYPVVGGFARPDAALQPGAASVSSHGSMCAADVMVAAPFSRLYDYPFLGIPRSGGALQMFQAVLNQRNVDGTPHLTNNSYGFTGVPDVASFPNHEIHNPNHPLHRKVREVVAAGVPCFFAAGNCGQNCPSGDCHPSGIGPGISIHASNSLAEVITVAAVNSRHERIGYSSQGPGMFEQQKPDVASYSHFFGNFGPGRPAGGTTDDFDNGTSAATPVAAGVAAALMSANPALTPAQLKDLMINTSADVGPVVGWDPDHGHGIVNAAAAFMAMNPGPRLVS
ncbi:MAG: S8 family serine peptidase [Pseudomonadota bacterium]